MRPIRSAVTLYFALLGRLLQWVGHLFIALSQRWGSERTQRTVERALLAFRSRQRISPESAAWEQQLLRVAPSVLVGIGGALVIFWTLLALGTALVWLVGRFGPFVLLAVILIGAFVGSRLGAAYRDPTQSRYN